MTAIQANGTVLLGWPYARLDAGERQQYMQLWQSRRLTDDVSKAIKSDTSKGDAAAKAEKAVGPSYASELEAD